MQKFKMNEEKVVTVAQTAGTIFTVLSALCTIVFGTIISKNGVKRIKSGE